MSDDRCHSIEEAIDLLEREIASISEELNKAELGPAERKKLIQARKLAKLRVHRRTIELKACRASGLHLDTLEVTQAIQDLQQSVPLIAGKTTVVRAYLSYHTSPPVTVTGELAIERGGATQTVPSLKAVVVDPMNGGDLAATRKDVELSLNFLLPDASTAPGDVTVRLASVTDVATGNPVDFDAASSKNIRFLSGSQLRIRLFAMRYRQGVPAVAHKPTPNDFAMLLSWLKRAYPIPGVLVVSSQATIDVNVDPPFQCNDVNAQLAAIRALDMSEGGDNRTHYYGLTSDGGFAMRGCAAGVPQSPDPTVVASGPTGAGNWPWDTDGSYGDWYGGHEIGHTFGRKHPGFCGESDDDRAKYPYYNGQLANDETSFVGFDVGDEDLGLPMVALPGTEWHDVMTYCESQWPSAYTYLGIQVRLLAEQSFASGAADRRGGGGRPDAGPEPAERGVGGTPPGDKLVSVIGSVNLTRGTGKIEYVNALARGAVRGLDRDSQVSLRVKVNGDEIAGDYAVELKFSSEIETGADRTALVDAILKIPSETRAIDFMVGGKVVDTYAATPPPRSEGPLQGILEGVAGPLRTTALRWSRTGHPRHTYAIQASEDEGQTWSTLAVGLAEPEFTVEHDQFPDAHRVQVRVLATNGFDRTEVGRHTVEFDEEVR